MSIIGSNILAGASGQAAGGGYAISRSLRFNSSDSAFLSRTPASAGNRKTWTFACWLKKGKSSISQSIFSNSTATEAFKFDSDTLYFYSDTGNNGLMTTNAVLRDPSAWYHVLLSVDTTQATAANRANIYINGVLQTLNLDTRPTQNYNTLLNSATALQIGGPTYFDGYLADIHFIDGQALDPTSFGEFDATTGVWVPIEYTGTYGTNGFHLDFADNSSNTATTLGKDTSGNGNNWTPNNLSVTAGAGNDSLVDVPTNGPQTDTGAGGEVRGNYATLNPLQNASADTFSDGNLQVVTSSANYGTHTSTIATPLSGKWYAETTVGSASSYSVVGLVSASSNFTATSWPGSLNGVSYYGFNGQKIVDTSASSYGATFGNGDVIGIAYDADSGSVTFYKNGVSQGAITSVAIRSYYFAGSDYDGSGSVTYRWNFGQRPFAYTAPSGFKALCTANLPAPVVTKPNEVMDVALWTGNGGNQSITLPGGFNPDLVWVKSRSNSQDHYLFDAIRGGAGILRSNTTGAETTGTTYLSFDTSGFSSLNGLSSNGYTYAGWCWDAGSSTVTNTVGSISSQVRANASAGFSVVTYTGTGAAGTIGHGLGIAPSMIILKNRTSAVFNWLVYHSSRTDGYLPQQNMLFLNSTSVGGTGNNYPWNNTAPTSTVFSIGSADYGQITSGNSIVAYCWAPVAGYSSFGSYTGNGSTDGPFVYTGFRPAFVLVKMSSSTGNWTMLDTKRLGYNVDNNPLFPNLSNAEGTTDLIDITSNGFKVRTTDATFNTNAGTYVFAAWAESPFQYARAR